MYTLIQSLHSAPASPPEEVTGYAVNSTHILLSWNPPVEEDQNGLVRSYTISITELQTNIYFTFEETTQTEIVVGSLHPYYGYECTVSAVTIAPGPYSEPRLITTPQDGKYIAVPLQSRKEEMSVPTLHNILKPSQKHACSSDVTISIFSAQFQLLHHVISLSWLPIQLPYTSHGTLHYQKTRMASSKTISSMLMKLTRMNTIRSARMELLLHLPIFMRSTHTNLP